eukprot:TRINITY_DN10778_c0_g2_i1.p1 TRINITY_DN10778_c0_g2~~TRINITY_DN10778_c0_g2_i1.p1  ORF type:complete len:354 (+),score=146.00 TRINITY_DN10778_c0_g2_i1:79-1062(+)
MAILGLDTTLKKGIFFLYMALWSGMRLVTYGSKREGSGAPAYNETSLLVFVSFTKLFIATGMFVQSDGTLGEMVQQFQANLPLFYRYFLPAMSYVVYDNLTFINLSFTDPVTYVVLMQMRIAVTGIVWSIFFGKPLNKNQWIAIGLLTLACLTQKGVDIAAANVDFVSILLICFQIGCGVFSSVFNELLLKEKGSVGVNLQNVFMYTHSIMCNIFWLWLCPSKTWCKSDLATAMDPAKLAELLHPWVLPIGVILSCIGIITSLFIKHLDSVRKTIASAMEIFVDAILAFALFGIPLTANTLVACGLAAGGVVLFSKKPEETKPDLPK